MTESMPVETASPSARSGAMRASRIAFRATAIVEACTWAAMLVAMMFKYQLDGPPMAVTVCGWLHGAAWIAFMLSLVAEWFTHRWQWWTVPVGFVASLVPLMTLPFAAWLEEGGRIARRTAREDAPIYWQP